MEIWKSIEGYEDLYLISSYGQIKSIRTNKILKLNYKKNGYVYVELNKEGTPKTIRVHRLVATAFVENNYNKPYVNHIDGNKSNNNSDNLEWVTGTENNLHAMQIKTVTLEHLWKYYTVIDLYGNAVFSGKGQDKVCEFLSISKSTLTTHAKNKTCLIRGKFKGYKILVSA